MFGIILLSLVYYLLIHPDTYLEDKDHPPRAYLRSVHSGFLRGILMGIMLGSNPVQVALQNGVLFACVNPLMMYMGY
jgi:hypothetical protein